MKEQSAAENILLKNNQLEPTNPKKQPDIKIVKTPRDRQGSHFFKKEEQKRRRLSGDVKNLLRATLGQDVFSREDQPMRLMDDKDNTTHSENPNSEKINAEEIFLGKENNKKNNMGKKIEAGNTLPEQLVAKKEAIEKVIVPDNPENLANNQAGVEQGAEEVAVEKVTEAKKDETIEKKDIKQAVSANAKKPKEDRIKIVDVAGNQRKVADERIAELGRKLAAAYKKSKNPKQEYELTKPVKDEIFDIIQEQNPEWMKKNKKDGEERIRGKVVKIIEKNKDQVRSEEKEKKEKLENLKKQLEETYKTFYEDYLNKGQGVPAEMLKLLDGAKQELFDAWPAWQKGGKEKQASLRNFIEEMKGKYRKKKDSPETTSAIVDKPSVADKPIEKPADKKIKPQSTAEPSRIISGFSFSPRDERTQEKFQKEREEIEKNREDKKRFEDIQEKIKKRKTIATEDAKFAQDYLVREEGRKVEAERKIAARAKAEERKPVPVAPKRVEKADFKKIKPAVPEKKIEVEKTAEPEKLEAPKDEIKKMEEIDAKAVREARKIALMTKYGIKSSEDLKRMGF